MSYDFRLADLGEGVQEGEIVRWLVAPGETIAAEQPLVEVMTDKVTAELPAPVPGRVLTLHGNPGDVVPVGSILVSIETDGPAPAQRGSHMVSGAAPAADPRANGGGSDAFARAVPAVRRLARELDVDLQAVRGSGPGGRITLEDVRGAAGGEIALAIEASATPEPGARRIPLRGMRRVIAQHMLDSHLTTAPYTFVEEVDFTELVGLRERVQPMARKAGVRMTYLPFIIAAVSMALREHPNLNATSDPETGDLLVSPEQHIAIAVHTDDGLIVPVIQGVEKRNLLDLAQEVERLSQAARAGKLSLDDLKGGTFTLTSLGPMGGVMGTPMLNTPQVAVMGVHRIGERPVVRDGQVVPRQTANISLTLDHRYIDGYVGAHFATTVKGFLEDPALMLFWLAEVRDH